MTVMAKYIMGVAAKSNVEKRQVGCIIVIKASDSIIAEGYNDNEHHAEYHACHSLQLKNSCAGLPDNTILKAYVTHAPCPACAKILLEHGITDVEVIEAFMKFDGDKLRFDLVSGKFMLWLKSALLQEDYEIDLDTPMLQQIKKNLWDYEEYPKCVVGQRWALTELIVNTVVTYKDALEAEEALARVLTFGARKYKANNWKKCTDTGRYLAACHRHVNKMIKGEQNDDETGFDHKDHLLTNLMFLYILGLQYD